MNQTVQIPQDHIAPMNDSIARVGRIVAVTGAHAIILLDAETGGANLRVRQKP